MPHKLSATMRIVRHGHVVFAKLWFLPACLLLWLSLAYPGAAEGELLGLTISKTILINFLILPGAVGMLLLAAILSARSHWGFVRYWWIAVKAGLGIAALAATIGLFLFPDNHMWLTGYSLLTIVLFAVAVALSLLKPWGKTGLDV